MPASSVTAVIAVVVVVFSRFTHIYFDVLVCVLLWIMCKKDLCYIEKALSLGLGLALAFSSGEAKCTRINARKKSPLYGAYECVKYLFYMEI